MRLRGTSRERVPAGTFISAPQRSSLPLGGSSVFYTQPSLSEREDLTSGFSPLSCCVCVCSVPPPCPGHPQDHKSTPEIVQDDIWLCMGHHPPSWSLLSGLPRPAGLEFPGVCCDLSIVRFKARTNPWLSRLSTPHPTPALNPSLPGAGVRTPSHAPSYMTASALSSSLARGLVIPGPHILRNRCAA